MNKIKKIFQEKSESILNVYFTAGFPEKEDTVSVIQYLDQYGVDLIEIGMPFSDPMADGPTIQKSSARALKNGMSMDVLFSQIRMISPEIDAPLIIMGYLNQLMQYGEERFLHSCAESGVSGLIIPDLPPELFRTQYRELFQAYGVEIIFLITPQTSDSRIRMIDELSDSFIYVVSDSSITGKTRDISEEQLSYFRRVQEMNLINPTLIGFGISDNKSFNQACQYASGAIIGSAFINTLDAAQGIENIESTVKTFIGGIKGN